MYGAGPEYQVTGITARGLEPVNLRRLRKPVRRSKGLSRRKEVAGGSVGEGGLELRP